MERQKKENERRKGTKERRMKKIREMRKPTTQSYQQGY